MIFSPSSANIQETSSFSCSTLLECFCCFFFFFIYFVYPNITPFLINSFIRNFIFHYPWAGGYLSINSPTLFLKLIFFIIESLFKEIEINQWRERERERENKRKFNRITSTRSCPWLMEKLCTLPWSSLVPPLAELLYIGPVRLAGPLCQRAAAAGGSTGQVPW